MTSQLTQNSSIQQSINDQIDNSIDDDTLINLQVGKEIEADNMFENIISDLSDEDRRMLKLKRSSIMVPENE
jgi:hypothetical protein